MSTVVGVGIHFIILLTFAFSLLQIGSLRQFVVVRQSQATVYFTSSSATFLIFSIASWASIDVIGLSFKSPWRVPRQLLMPL